MPTLPIGFDPPYKLYAHEKPGIRYYKLLKTLREIPPGVSKRLYIDEMDDILTQLYMGKEEAARLESKGHAEEASKLYQQLVEAHFDDPQPYLRLREFYIKFQEPELAAQVCAEYIKMATSLKELGYDHPHREALIESFAELCNVEDG